MSTISHCSEDLEFATDCIFRKYDPCEEGTLEAEDLIKIMRDAFRCLKIDRKVTL